METIDDIAAARRTVKVLPDPAEPLAGEGLARETVEGMVSAAGWAPFHRACRAGRAGEGAPEPWRVHMLDREGCRDLLGRLDGFAKAPGKIANMLAAADACLLVTWLPEEGGRDWTPSIENMEHIAAAGSMIQTLLLSATERGIGSYWSSGGVLATGEALGALGAGDGEVLLGAVFLWPEVPAGVETAPGKLRAQRRGVHDWARWTDPRDR